MNSFNYLLPNMLLWEFQIVFTVTFAKNSKGAQKDKSMLQLLRILSMDQ